MTGGFNTLATQADGTFSFDTLPMGTYVLALLEGGHSVGRSEFVIDPTHLTHQRDIVLAVSELTGRVLLGDGVTPVSGRPVFILKTGQKIHQTVTDDNGRFKFLISSRPVRWMCWPWAGISALSAGPM